MRKFFLLSLLPLFCLLCSCDASRLSTLPELTRPYAGTYACEELTLGGRDMRRGFGRLELELKQDGAFVLSYETAGGEGSVNGRYAVNAEGDEIELRLTEGGRERARTYPYLGGAIVIAENIGGALLRAVFRLP